MSELGSVLHRGVTPSTARSRRLSDYFRSIGVYRVIIVVSSLICGDVASTLVVVTAAGRLAGPGQPHDRGASAALLLLIFFLLRLYTGRGPAPPERFRLRAIGVSCFVAIQISAEALTLRWPLVLTVSAFETTTLLALGYYVECFIRATLIRFDLWGAPTAVLGGGERSRNVASFLIDQPSIGLKPIDFIEEPSFNANSATLKALSPTSGEPLLRDGSRHPFEVVIATSAHDLSIAIFSEPKGRPKRYLLVGEESDLRTLWVRTRAVGGRLGMEMVNDLRLPHNRVLKRTIDLLVAIPVAAFALPVIAALALAIKLVDPGPAFFIQTRVGLNGAPLRMIKLRSMYVNAEQRLAGYLSENEQARAEWRKFFKLANDPRILPFIGSFMRRASLDELPQIWNVIRGDMSLVGPRPFPAYHMSAFDDDFRAIRLSVLPGITGMWQISSRSEGDLAAQRAQDSFYIRNWSIWLDFYILLETAPAVLAAKGAK